MEKIRAEFKSSFAGLIQRYGLSAEDQSKRLLFLMQPVIMRDSIKV